METMGHTRQVIKDLKNPPDSADISHLPVTMDQCIVAFLRPVLSVPDKTTSRDAQWMAEWRNNHRQAFFTWITATKASTQTWLAKRYADNFTDIMFMLETTEHQPLGHLALYNFTESGKCEFGRVLQNPTPGKKIKGAMTLGSFALLRWATSVLHIKNLSLEVFEHNRNAVSLYNRLGFKEKSKFLLKKTNINGETHWKKIHATPHNDIPSKEILTGLRMELSSKQLQQAYEKYSEQWTTMGLPSNPGSYSKSDPENKTESTPL